MYSRILVPVDGSDTSRVGLMHAVSLAKGQRSRLRLLNVVDHAMMMPAMNAYPNVGDMTFLLDSLETSGKKALAEALEVCERNAITAETALARSRGRFVSDAILSDARKWRADVIVMGTHGRRGLGRLLLGSDAERVVREANVPVILVRGRKDGGSPTAKGATKTRQHGTRAIAVRRAAAARV